MTARKPPFRADHVGSLLRPKALREARERRATGAIGDEQLKGVEDREIRRAVARQEAVGLQSITDGEFRRSWWSLDFLWGLKGIERFTPPAGVAFAGVQTRSEGIQVTGKLDFESHPMLDHFAFLKAQTRRTPKMTIPSPSTVYGRPVPLPVDREVYPDMDALFEDLGQAYRKAVRAFADAGCRYLQLDEVYLTMLCDEAYRRKMVDRGDDPERLASLYADLINVAVSGAPPEMTVAMHLCRGNYRSTFMGSGGYDAVQEVLFDRINVHAYFMEYDDERSGGFEPLRRLPKDKVVVLGLMTTKAGRLEDKAMLKRRVDEAARYAPLEQLAISGQCGFASTEEGNALTEDEQWAKLERLVEVADEVWQGR